MTRLRAVAAAVALTAAGLVFAAGLLAVTAYDTTFDLGDFE